MIMMTVITEISESELTITYRTMVLSKLTGRAVRGSDSVLIQDGILIYRSKELGDQEVREATQQDVDVLKAMLVLAGYKNNE